MDQLLSTFGRVIIAAALAGVGTEVVKRIVPEEYHKGRFFKAAINGFTVILSFILVGLVQRLGFVPAGWEYTATGGIIAAGLAVLGYEGFKNVIRGVAGDSIGGDSIGGDKTGDDAVSIGSVHGDINL